MHMSIDGPVPVTHCESFHYPGWTQASFPQPPHLSVDPHQDWEQRTQEWLGQSPCRTLQMEWSASLHTSFQAVPQHIDWWQGVRTRYTQIGMNNHAYVDGTVVVTHVTALVMRSGLNALIMHSFCREFLFFHSWGNFSFSGHSLSTNFFHLLAEP